MRKGAWLLAVVAGAAFTQPAWAQRTLGPWAKLPAKLENRPLDMTKSVAPVLPAAPTNPFSLTRFLPKMFRPGSPTQAAISPLPAPSAFPSTQYVNGFKPIPDNPKKKY